MQSSYYPGLTLRFGLPVLNLVAYLLLNIIKKKLKKKEEAKLWLHCGKAHLKPSFLSLIC